MASTSSPSADESLFAFILRRFRWLPFFFLLTTEPSDDESSDFFFDSRFLFLFLQHVANTLKHHFSHKETIGFQTNSNGRLASSSKCH